MEVFAEIELQYTWKKLSIDEVFKDADSIPAANRFRLFFSSDQAVFRVFLGSKPSSIVSRENPYEQRSG